MPVSSERSVGPDGSPCCSVRPVQLAARHGYCSCGPTQLHAVISPPPCPLPSYLPSTLPCPPPCSSTSPLPSTYLYFGHTPCSSVPLLRPNSCSSRTPHVPAFLQPPPTLRTPHVPAPYSGHTLRTPHVPAFFPVSPYSQNSPCSSPLLRPHSQNSPCSSLYSSPGISTLPGHSWQTHSRVTRWKSSVQK